MFHTNVPATHKAFLDRKREIGRLDEIVDALASGAPKWLAILGPRKIGKTSLMIELARRTQRAGVRFVILDVMADAPVTAEFFRHYALRALDAVVEPELGASLEALAHDPGEYRAVLTGSTVLPSLPAPLRRFVLDLPELDLGRATVRTCLDLPERLAEARGLKILVAVDELQELAGLRTKRGGMDPFSIMRSVWQKHARVAYVVSGSGRSMLEEMITSPGAPFFQHFATMDLGPFTLDDAVRLLVKLAPEDRPIPAALARSMARVVGGHPFYLQLAGETLTQESPPYDASSMKAALQQLLFSRTGRLSLYFQNEFDRVVGRSGHLAAVLEALAEGPARLSDVARRLSLPSGTTVRYIERLGDTVTHLEDGRYAIGDALFALWLRWRSPGGTVVPMTVLGDEAERAVAAHLARMGAELVYQSRASRGAFDLLALYGGTHLGVQVKRSALPVRFDRATWSRMSADAARLGWRWILAAVDDAGSVRLLDPTKGSRRREVRVGEGALVENLARWL